MTDDNIVAVEIQETEYGEKVVLQSPFDAKDFIKALPFMEYGNYDNYTAEMERNGVADGAMHAAEDFGFSDEFSTHRSWNPTALGQEVGAWLVDVDSLDETIEFLEFCGFEVENNTDL